MTALVVFPAASLLAALIASRASRVESERTQIAAAWATSLMQGCALTRYGWMPQTRIAAQVDAALARHGAAYLLVDPAQRVRTGSKRLGLQPGSLTAFGTERFADVAPLGTVEITRTDTRHFGTTQGEFLLLRPRDRPRPPPPGDAAVSGELNLPGWRFLLIGSGLSMIGLFAAAQLLVSRRVRNLIHAAKQPIDTSRSMGRFATDGSDEVALLATTLNATRRKAQRLLASMSRRESNRRDWLSELSHDLRTPLAALNLRLHNAVEAQTMPQLRDLVATAVRDCERIQTLAAGFMDLAELEVTEDFAFEEVMPEELVGQAVRGLRPIAEEAGVACMTRVSPQPTIHADGHRLLRALENILRNAIRHAHSRVVVGVESTRTEVRFFVLDDGDGFPGLEVGKPYNYVDWLGRRQAGGLGLRVADRIARAHDGRLVLCNRDEGTLVVCTVELGFATRDPEQEDEPDEDDEDDADFDIDADPGATSHR